LTTIAPPAASRYSRPAASVMIEPLAREATGGSAAAERRNTRLWRGELGWSVTHEL
jgi:hypothetical protein